MKRAFLALVAAGAAVLATAAGAASSAPDVVVENARLRLVIGADARAKSLVVKATGEEMLDTTEDVPTFSVVQDRPFNNEIKLLFPNKRTEFRADRVRRVAHVGRGDALLASRPDGEALEPALRDDRPLPRGGQVRLVVGEAGGVMV